MVNRGTQGVRPFSDIQFRRAARFLLALALAWIPLGSSAQFPNKPVTLWFRSRPAESSIPSRAWWPRT